MDVRVPSSLIPDVYVLAAVLAVAAITFLPQHGWSQSSDSSDQGTSAKKAGGLDSLSDEKKKKLLELVKAGRKAYSQGNFEEVVPKMKQAYEIYPDPEFLYRIALSYERDYKPRKAIKYYERYLEEKPNSEKRGRIEKTVANLKERVKDEPKETAETEAEEPADDEQTKTAQTGESTTAQTETRGRQPQPQTSRSSSPSVVPVVMLVTGGVFAGSATTFGILNLQQRSKVNDLRSNSQDKRRSETDFDATVRQQNLFAGLTYASAALAAGALTWGIIGLSSQSGSEQPPPRANGRGALEIDVALSPTGLTLFGKF